MSLAYDGRAGFGSVLPAFLVASLARFAVELARDVSITVNNKAEGSAPLSVAKLAVAIMGV